MIQSVNSLETKPADVQERRSSPVTTSETPDFRDLFRNYQPASKAPAAPAPTATPLTAPAPAVAPGPSKLEIGDDAFVAQPTGKMPDGRSYGFNPVYFASDETAQKIADLVGGIVVKRADLVDTGGFAQDQLNNMIQMPNGKLINAGLLASVFTHGYSEYYCEQFIARETSA